MITILLAVVLLVHPTAGPFRTITAAAREARDGDVIQVSPGTYSESLFGVLRAGVTVAGLTPRPLLRAPAGSFRGLDLTGVGRVTLRGIVFDCAAVQYDCAKLTDAPQVTLEDVDLLGAPENGLLIVDWQAHSRGFVGRRLRIRGNGTSDFHHGAYVSSDDALVEDSEVSDNAGWGLHCYHEGGGPNGCRLIGNHVHDNARLGARGEGVIVSGGTGHVVSGNLVSGNQIGIWVDYGADGARVTDNVIVRNRGAAIYIGASSRGAVVSGNQWAANGADLVDDHGLATVATNNRDWRLAPPAHAIAWKDD